MLSDFFDVNRFFEFFNLQLFMGNKRYQEYMNNTVFFCPYCLPNHGETDEGEQRSGSYIFFRYFRTACTTIEQGYICIYMIEQLASLQLSRVDPMYITPSPYRAAQIDGEIKHTKAPSESEARDFFKELMLCVHRFLVFRNFEY